MSNKLDKLDLGKFRETYKKEIDGILARTEERRYLVVEEGARLRNLGQFPMCGVDGWNLKKESSEQSSTC